MADSDLPAGLSAPARRALASAGVSRLDDLTHLSEDEVAALHGMGPKAPGLLRTALADAGLSFAEARSSNSRRR